MKKTAWNPGLLPPWEKGDLPPPLPFSPRNILRVIGPGAIALSLSVGGGEWLFGPAVAVKYGPHLLWISLCAIVLQAFLNLEFCRYTLATGEPVLSGFMRKKPGPRFWGWLYSLMGLLQLGWPAWALGSAPCLFAAFAGRLSGDEDYSTVLALGYLCFAATLLLVIFGGRIERTLEIFSTVIMAFSIGFLIIVNVLFVPLSTWASTACGFFHFGSIPEGVEWPLLATLAAFSGAGGLGNCWITNWVRDKGFGMSKSQGYISTLIHGRRITIPRVGNSFPLEKKNLSHWKTWGKYLAVDQGVLFGAGSLLALFLSVSLSLHFIPRGTDLQGLAAGSFQAHYLAKAGGRTLWFLTLLVGFCFLFGTQVSIIDGLTRTLTDMLWTSSPSARRRSKNDVRVLYYFIFLFYLAWGCIGITVAQPVALMKVAGVMGVIILTVSGIHILVVNNTLLPPPLRSPLWKQAMVGLSVLFYGGLGAVLFLSLLSRSA